MKSKWSELVLALTIAISMPAMALEDPTRPPNLVSQPAQTEPEVVFSLDSIMLGPQKRVAVIDGVARREGDVFANGVELLRVYPDQVRLLVKGKQRVLHWAADPQIRVSQ